MKKGTFEISQRYATALFELAQEQGAVVEVVSQSKRIRAALDEEALRTMASPALTDEERHSLLETLVSSLGLGELLANTLRLISANGRFLLVPEVLSLFEEHVDESMGIVRAALISARPADPTTLSQFEDALTHSLGKKVFLIPKVDESLKAGFVVRIGNTVVDASLKTRLENLRESLTRGV